MPAASSFYLGKGTVQQHVDQALSEIIQPDEWLLAAFHGQALSGEGYGAAAKTKGGFSLHHYLFVTDQRVIFWARGIFKRSTDGFHYDDIASVEEATGMMLGEIVLNVRGVKERMRSMVKTDVPIAARLIRDLVAKARSRTATLAPTPAPSAIYILREDGAQDGPFDAAQVQQKVFAGEVTPDAYAWHEGLTEWQPLSQIIRLPSLPAPRTTSLPVAPTQEAVAPAETVLSVSPVSLDAAPPGPATVEPTPPTPSQTKELSATDKGCCLGCFGAIVLIVIFLVAGHVKKVSSIKKEFAEQRDQILADARAAADAHNYQHVVELGDRYSYVRDLELDSYLRTARAALKAADEKVAAEKKRVAEEERTTKAQTEAIEDSLRQPDPAKSQTYRNAWLVAYHLGKEKREAGEQPIGQYLQMAALEWGKRAYPLSPVDQMNFAEGFMDGFNAGYATDTERRAQAGEIAAQRRAEADRNRLAERERKEAAAAQEQERREAAVAAEKEARQKAAAAAEEKAREDAITEERAKRRAAVPVADRSGMTTTQWKQKAAKAFQWSWRQPLIAPVAQFQQIMGKPNSSQTVSSYVFWYYECSDGTVQLEADAEALQTGTIQAQVSDEAGR